MSSTTPLLGITIPEDTDIIAELAAILAQGFTDVENTLMLAENSRVRTDPVTAWPRGMSLMGVTSTGASEGNWPDTGGLILNLRRYSSALTHQIYFAGSIASQSRVWIRTGSTDGWSAWRLIANAAMPIAEATGQVTLTTANGNGAGLRAVNIQFPSGRFSNPPRVMVSLNQTSRPDLAGAPSTFNVTTSGCTILVERHDDLGQSVVWHAVEGVEG